MLPDCIKTFSSHEVCIDCVGLNCRTLYYIYTYSYVATAKAAVAAMQGVRGMTHQSAYLLQKAILMHYRTHDLFPPGLCADAECSQVWALKPGNALRKLVA